jgi:hypothetical protein
MAHGDFDLTRVIDPIPPDEFFAQYWEQQPLIVQREDRGYYDGLLSMADVDHIISGTGLRYPALRLVKTGASIPTSSYTRDLPWGGDVFTRVVDADRVFAEYQAGATIVLQALHRSWRPLGLFCRDLERLFHYPVQTNIYLTPPSAQGFAAHYDTHDVFVLQMAGAKHWRIYDSPVPLPDKTTPYSAKGPQARLMQEVDLQAGDLIYLPRGYVHEALTSDRESLHVTVGVIAVTWGDLLADALAALRKRDPRFRQSVPMDSATVADRLPALRDAFGALAQALGEQTDVAGLIDQTADRFMMGRPPLLAGRLAELNSLGTLDAQTPVRRRRGLIYRLTEQGDTVTLRYEGKTLTLPGYVAPALRFAAAQDGFRAADVPGLDAAGRLVLVRRLVKEGFLTVAREE